VSTPDAHDLIGQTIGPYVIAARIGGGGMGVVYRARDTKLGRTVALKFLPPQWSHDEDARQRFIREAQAASATNHPNICTIHDIATAPDGQLFIVMAYYEGQTLKQRLASGPLSVDEALEIATQIADGLAKAHAQGIVHRDVKPGNVILTEDGARIVDFGLATFADALKLTVEHSTMGTAAYMSPEQVRGQSADARSDVWAVGIILYEMLTGHVPFQGSHAEAIGYAVRNETPPPIRAVRSDVGEGVEQLVFRAIHKQPSVRFENGRELARGLRQVRGLSLPLDLRTMPVPSPRATIRDRTPDDTTGRWKVWTTAAAALVLATVVGWWSYGWLAPVERIPIAVAPIVNQTRYSELDSYRLALTYSLVTELSESPNVRVLPYSRLLQIIRRFLAGGSDMASREAVLAISEQGGPRFLVLPALVYENDRWRAQAEIQDAATSTRVALLQTAGVPSAIPKEVSYSLIVQIASAIQEHFKANGPGKSYSQRPSSARLRSLDAAKSVEHGLNALESLEYSAAEKSFLQARDQDARNPVPHALLSRVSGILRKSDQASESAEAAARLVSANTPRTDTLLVNAIVAETRRDYQAAEAGYRELVVLYPDEPSWLIELGSFQDRRTRVEDAIVSYQKALALDRHLARPDVELCRMYNRLDDFANAKKHAREALTKYRALGAREGEVPTLFCLAEVLRAGSPEDRQEARRLTDTALAIVQELGLEYNLSWALHYVALARAEEGKLAEGAAFWEKAAAAAKTAGNKELEPVVLLNLGVTNARLGNRKRAMEFYGLSSQAHQAAGNELRAARALVNRSQLRIDFGDSPDQAVEDVRNALAVFVQQGDRNFQVFSRQALGSYYRSVARYAEADQELRLALAIAQERDLKEDIAALNIELARVRFDQNDYAASVQLLETVGDTFDQQSLHAWIRLARTRTRLGDFTTAQALLRNAEDDVAKRKNTEYLPLLYETRGELDYERNQLADARMQFNRAAVLWTDDLPDPSSVEAKAFIGWIDAQQGRAGGRALIEASLAQAAKMRQVALEARCRIFLARALLREHAYEEALNVLNAIRLEGPQAVGPELLAQTRYWRGQALAARGNRAEADAETTSARKLLDGLLAMLSERDRGAYAMRRDISAIVG
jgi:serine/threonine protein kinase/tetratricopeptide (TPR) repeat protein